MMTPHDDNTIVEVLRARESQWRKLDIGGFKLHTRTFVMSWMYNRAYIIGLHPRTIMLSMSLLDRYATTHQIVLENFDKLTLACIWVAAKYDEVARFSLSTMLRLSIPNDLMPAVTAGDLRSMEVELLNALDHRLSIPTPFDFMEAVCFEECEDMPSLDLPVQMVIHYMALSLPTHPPSELAWAALAAAGIKVPEPANPELVIEMKKHA